MSGDYGAVAHWRPLRGFWLAAVVAGVALGAVLAANWSYHRRVEREQGWVGAGPVCATLSGAAYAARGYRTHERAMDYDGATIARQFGHVMQGRRYAGPLRLRHPSRLPVHEPGRDPRPPRRHRGVLRAGRRPRGHCQPYGVRRPLHCGRSVHAVLRPDEL